jgi:hypothetical protein
VEGLSQNLDLDMQARDSLFQDIDTLKPFHSTCRLKDVDYGDEATEKSSAMSDRARVG